MVKLHIILLGNTQTSHENIKNKQEPDYSCKTTTKKNLSAEMLRLKHCTLAANVVQDVSIVLDSKVTRITRINAML